MIKLIATDVDGTLVKDSARDVSDEMIQIIEKLCEKGIIFTVASGRQYGSISKMFQRANANIHYIAENGAHIVVDNETIFIKEMERSLVEELILDLRQYYEIGCNVIASTAKGCLIEHKEEDFIDLIKNGYRNEIELVDDILAVEEPIIKIAIYRKNSIRDIGESTLIPKWKSSLKTCMAGDEWVDFMDATVDKGNALKILQEKYHIQRDEMMAFGDNNNDKGMLCLASESYAVENAVEPVKLVAKHICPSNMEQGVYQVLNQYYHSLL